MTREMALNSGLVFISPATRSVDHVSCHRTYAEEEKKQNNMSKLELYLQPEN